VTVFWDVTLCRAITLMTEAVCTSETVSFYQTIWHKIPEDSHLHTHHCENLKSHIVCLVQVEFGYEVFASKRLPDGCVM
jgi:hypothetical protein